MKRQVTIWVHPDDEAPKKVGELIGEMGFERMALRAKKSAVALLVISSFSCLFSALAGYLLHAVGPSMVLMVVAGFAAIFESRRPSSHTIRRTGSRS